MLGKGVRGPYNQNSTPFALCVPFPRFACFPSPRRYLERCEASADDGSIGGAEAAAAAAAAGALVGRAAVAAAGKNGYRFGVRARSVLGAIGVYEFASSVKAGDGRGAGVPVPVTQDGVRSLLAPELGGFLRDLPETRVTAAEEEMHQGMGASGDEGGAGAGAGSGGKKRKGR